MKNLSLVVLMFASLHIVGHSQSIDYNKIILPDHIQSPDFAEKLVQIAWKNHPLNEVARQDFNKAKVDVWRINADWLNFINLQSNINEFVLNPTADVNNRANFYPKYNIRFSLNVGQFFQIPFDTKKAKYQVVVMESNLNARKLELRNSVMKAYNEFLLREKSYKIRSSMLSDVESFHKLVEQKFKNGEATYEAFSLSQRNFSQLSISFLESERDYKNSKLDLEALIGIRLEDVR